MLVMTSTHPSARPATHPGATTPRGGFLPFLTPVRGHAFATPPPDRAAPVHHGAPALLRREPDNPADPLAVAVWATATDGGAWRIGYLERAVAARVAPRLDDGVAVTATLAGWWDEPRGRWRRPVVALEPANAPRLRPAPTAPRGVWSRPPASITRPVSRARR
jgi:hypothetical protein